MKSKVFLTLLNVFLAVILISPSAEAKKAKIKDGMKVKFDYTLTVDGNIVDTSEGKQPLEYTHGEGKIIAGLSKKLKGLDSLLSIAQMPAGVPVGSLAVGESGAKNAALLAISILSGEDKILKNKYKSWRLKQTQSVNIKPKK